MPNLAQRTEKANRALPLLKLFIVSKGHNWFLIYPSVPHAISSLNLIANFKSTVPYTSALCIGAPITTALFGGNRGFTCTHIFFSQYYTEQPATSLIFPNGMIIQPIFSTCF